LTNALKRAREELVKSAMPAFSSLNDGKNYLQGPTETGIMLSMLVLGLGQSPS
jgi:hypothetical protein